MTPECLDLLEALRLTLCPVCEMMHGSDAPGIFCLACADTRAVIVRAEARAATSGDKVTGEPRLLAAVRALYYAAHWTADRPVDAVALWTEVRDAAGFAAGSSPKPVPEESGLRAENERLNVLVTDLAYERDTLKGLREAAARVLGGLDIFLPRVAAFLDMRDPLGAIDRLDASTVRYSLGQTKRQAKELEAALAQDAPDEKEKA